MKYVSVYARTGSSKWYISYPGPDGRRKHKATSHGVGDHSGRRKAYDEAMQLAKQSAGRGGDWLWVIPWLRLKHSGRTLQRYESSWSHVQRWLLDSGVTSPQAVRYAHVQAYMAWRVSQKRPRGTFISHNTALLEVKVLGMVMRESVRRELVEANPLAQIGIRRKPGREKPAMTPDEIATIRTALLDEPTWMTECFEIAIHQGCRLTETQVPVDQVDLVNQAITFKGKAGKVFTTMLHPALVPLVRRKQAEGSKVLCTLPRMAAKAWHGFFRRIKLGHLCFHSTRVTVITQMARSGVPQGVAQSFVGHASATVHRIYQRLSVPDLARAVAAIPAWPGSQDGPAPTFPRSPPCSSDRHETASPAPASATR